MSTAIDLDTYGQILANGSCTTIDISRESWEPAEPLSTNESYDFPSKVIAHYYGNSDDDREPDEEKDDEEKDDKERNRFLYDISRAGIIRRIIIFWLNQDWYKYDPDHANIRARFLRGGVPVTFNVVFTEVPEIMRYPLPPNPHVVIIATHPQQIQSPESGTDSLCSIELNLIGDLGRRYSPLISRDISKIRSPKSNQTRVFNEKPPFFEYLPIRLVSISGTRVRIIDAKFSFAYILFNLRWGKGRLSKQQLETPYEDARLDLHISKYYDMKNDNDYMELMADILRKPKTVPLMRETQQKH
ncbi:uncharacterized protein KY384_005075 [Bacidia gigantensis]|uniref:uncharacterized protein n=1 Tax=Bacidia gigantensis TaxID=2732470 RepID=UPI001D04FC3F|nr:uncharacterized protein KY384_005075 [Bacidia gigantensis]KAG8530572.1 hypothetical protein KY384_005075 [Bacidia gigantensis]